MECEEQICYHNSIKKKGRGYYEKKNKKNHGTWLIGFDVFFCGRMRRRD